MTNGISPENTPISLPQNYKSFLDLRHTEEAIKYVKDSFQVELVGALNLARVSAPLFVSRKTGINDYLNGVEIPVHFKIQQTGEIGEVVQSLAKWKRQALGHYGFQTGEGLYTDMNAIRPFESLDNIHSLYVDQWDWERVMSNDERNLDFLKSIVRKIYSAVVRTERLVCRKYPQLPEPELPEEIRFIHAQDLEDKYPDLTPKDREHAVCRENKAVFIIGLGGNLKSGVPHDGRAADYDDWTTDTGDGRRGLNGDIVVWNTILNRSFELSSMGIRVNREALLNQLEIRGETAKTNMNFHQKLLAGQLPQTIGGGIGQSRLCMLFLRKAHIGEVQASIWPDDMTDYCESHNIFLL